MNLILFEPGEFERQLPLSDPRAIHIRKILGRQPGETFDAGIVDGAQGKACYQRVSNSGLDLEFEPISPPPDPEPITLLIGLPRPQTARRVLREASTIGVGAIHFLLTSRGDPGYGKSTLWSSGEYRRHLIAGTEQAFSTRLPRISHGKKLDEVLVRLDDHPTRFALDNYEAESRLADAPLTGTPAVLAVGSERGWSGSEREALKKEGFGLVDLGSRVLRTETAVVAGLVILRAGLGL
jgi:16S rRNA (uracil1498-N3)-methyltransferase